MLLINKSLRRLVINSKEGLKDEWNYFFWIRFTYFLLISVVLSLIGIEGLGYLKYMLMIGIYLLVSAKTLKDMINKENSNLVLILTNSDQKERIDVEFKETLRIYLSFFWRESISFIIVGTIYWLIGYNILEILIQWISVEMILLLITIIYMIGLQILFYFIGRKIFLSIIEMSTWGFKSIDLK